MRVTIASYMGALAFVGWEVIKETQFLGVPGLMSHWPHLPEVITNNTDWGLEFWWRLSQAHTAEQMTLGTASSLL